MTVPNRTQKPVFAHCPYPKEFHSSVSVIDAKTNFEWKTTGTGHSYLVPKS